ncbi:WbqC family protein [Chloroflexota bacterium]
MIVSIHQPEHIPWLGFFDKMTQAEVFVLLDNVQYRHKYFQNRNKIRSANGETWLNVPVLTKGRQEQLINEVEIDSREARWREKCWHSISVNYQKSPFFEKYHGFFKDLYEKEWGLLSDLNECIIRYIAGELNLNVKLVKASELPVSGSGEILILDICKELGATTYISGISGIAAKGREFEPAFSKERIEVVYQEFHHPIYQQVYKPFIPFMSTIDLLFNYGNKSPDVLKGIGVERMDTL